MKTVTRILDRNPDEFFCEGLEAAEQLSKLFNSTHQIEQTLILAEALGDLIDVPLTPTNMSMTCRRIEGFAVGVFEQHLIHVLIDAKEAFLEKEQEC